MKLFSILTQSHRHASSAVTVSNGDEKQKVAEMSINGKNALLQQQLSTGSCRR